MMQLSRAKSNTYLRLHNTFNPADFLHAVCNNTPISTLEQMQGGLTITTVFARRRISVLLLLIYEYIDVVEFDNNDEWSGRNVFHNTIILRIIRVTRSTRGRS